MAILYGMEQRIQTDLSKKLRRHLWLALAAATLIMQPSPGHADNIKPEMIVRFTKGGIACLDRDNLQEIIEHTLKGEETKVKAMLLSNGGGCIMLSPKQKLKVLSAEYNNPDPDLGVLEVIGADRISLHGAWTFSLGAEEVKATRRR